MGSFTRLLRRMRNRQSNRGQTSRAPAFESLESRVLLSAGGLLAAAIQSNAAEALESSVLTAPAVVHVTDSGVNDPGAYDSTLSDPLEDGSQEHPFDSIQEAIHAVASGGQVLVAGGTYNEALTIDKNLTLTGGYNGYDWDQPRDPGWHTTIVDASGLNQSVVRILDVDLTVDGFTLTHGSAPTGGGIYCDGGDQVIRACRIVGNNTWNGASTQPGGDGGGIYLSNASILLEDCDVGWNRTGDGGQGLSGSSAGRAGHGGGLFAVSSTVEITGCSFSNATGMGGSDDQGYATSGNGGDGGAIYIESSVLRITASHFSYSLTGAGGDKDYEYGRAGAGGNGGALCLRAGSAAQIIDCTFSDNSTGSGGNGTGGLDSAGGGGGHGGTIFCESSTLTVGNSSFARSATGDGGALGMYYPSGTSDGGALYALSSTVALRDCELVFNGTGRTGYYRYAYPSGRGGAACFLDSAVILDGCLVQRNRTGDGMAAARGNGSSGRGGGLYFEDCSGVQVRNCILAENSTGDLEGTDGENLNRTGSGGGLAVLNSPARIENCLIYGNATGDGEDMQEYANGSGDGGGIYCPSDAVVEIVGCTIVGNQCGLSGLAGAANSSQGQGGGIYASHTTLLANTIVWDHLRGNVVGCELANVSHCNIGDVRFDGVNHNLSADPRFVSGNTADYQLQPGSPCIGRGDNASVSPAVATDLAGNPRIAGQAVDIGAYESPADAAPGDVTGFTATPGDGQIVLNWANPGDGDFAGVKILRREGRSPRGPTDGDTVYDGSGSSWLDGGLVNDVVYHYRAFSYDDESNYSSGSIVTGTPTATDITDVVGYTTVFPNVSVVSNRRAMPVVMNQAGLLTSISVYHQGGTGNAILAAYADAAGRPGTRLGVTNSTPINGGEGWQTILLQSPATVSTGQTIWLAWVFENDPGMRWIEGHPGRASSPATWSGGMPGVFGMSTAFDGIYSVYATYDTGVDTTAPARVTGLAVTPGDRQVALTWTNPGDGDLAGVRIIRKTGDYPADPTDGVVAYDGSGTGCVDTGLTNDVTYYYAVFSYDEATNYSAPTTASATPVAGGSIETVGYSTIFPTISVVANRRAMPIVMSQAGILTSITLYHQGGSGDAILAAYDDVGGQPGTRLGMTDPTPVNAAAGWQTIALQNPVEVSAGQTVWLAWVFESDPGMRWIEGSPGRALSPAAWSDAMPEAFGESAAFGGIYSIYATYGAGTDVTPPANVVGLAATPGDGQIALTWANPGDGDFTGVRILRKEGGSPNGPADGVVVYDGPGTTHVDTGLSNGVTYSYAAFSYDEAANYSDGATATGTPMEGSVAETVGYTTVFPNVSSVSNRRAIPIRVTRTGVLTSISIYHQGGTGNAVLAVYADWGSKPGVRLGVTNATPIHSEEGWQTFTLQNPVEVVQYDDVWLAWVFENDPGIRWTDGYYGRAISTDAWSGGMPESFGASSWGDADYSIYATYGYYEE